MPIEFIGSLVNGSAANFRSGGYDSDSDEFIDIVKREWESATPFDYDGEFYQVKRARSDVRPEAGALLDYFAGASHDAVRVGGRQADVYAFWGEPLAAIIDLVRQQDPTRVTVSA